MLGAGPDAYARRDNRARRQGGHEGREMKKERERERGGNKYHPCRFLSQPLIVAYVH